MRPSLRQLEYFLALAEEQSFGRAAQALGISQPALSQQIRELEERLGATLFDRAPKGVRLTSAGAKTLEAAREILSRTQALGDLARSDDAGIVGQLSLGSISTVSPYLLAPALGTLREEHPSLQILVQDNEVAALERLLRRGKIDLLLMALMDPTRGTEQQPLVREPFVLVAPRDSRVGDAEGPVRPEELEGEALLLLGEAHCFRQNALTVCEMVGAHPHAGIHGTSFATLVAMVRGGLGMTLLPALAVDPELLAEPSLRVRAFAAPAPARTLGLVWRSGNPRVLEFETLADALRRSVSARPGLVDASVELV